MDKDFAYDDFYGKGDITIRCEDDPLKGNPNAILYPGAGLTVEEGVCDTTGIGNIVIGSDGDEAWGAVIAGCNLRVDSLIQNITIMGKKWYFLGFPFEVRIEDIYANAKYVIYEYDGAGLGYDLGADAAKFLTMDNGVPQIFSYDNENIEYAINERPMGTGTIELGVRLPKAGMYTISTARMDTAFYLLDRDQDRLHDFADGDYIFSAGAGMHTSRFALVRSRIPQDIDNATKDVRVEPAENGLYIQGNKPITIYNAAGMLVASGIENGLLPLPAGVYMVVAGSNAEKYIVK